MSAMQTGQALGVVKENTVSMHSRGGIRASLCTYHQSAEDE